MDYCWKKLQNSKLGRSTLCLSYRSGECDDGKKEGEQVVDFSSFFARVEWVLDGDEEIDRVAEMKADRNQFKKHVDTVVGDTEILLIKIGQNADVECQSVKNTLDVDEVLESK